MAWCPLWWRWNSMHVIHQVIEKRIYCKLEDVSVAKKNLLMWQHGGKYNKSRSVLVLLLEEILHLLISIHSAYTSQVVQDFSHPHYHLNHFRLDLNSLIGPQHPDRFDPPWLQTKATSDPWQSSSSPQQRGASMSYQKAGYKVMNTNPIHFFWHRVRNQVYCILQFFFPTPILTLPTLFSSDSPTSFPTRWLSTIVTFMPL